MAFTVNDFQDLLRLLEEHPEWRAELRRHILPDELLELPAIVSRLAERVEQLAEAQARTEQRLEQLAEAQARTEQRVEQLAEAQARTEQRVEALTERVDGLTVQVSQLVTQMTDLSATVKRLGDDVGYLKGGFFEIQYRERAPAYFARFARRLRVLDRTMLADRLDDAVDEGKLDEAERHEILRTDLVLSGRRREDGSEVYLLAEISAGIGPSDVERAARRAALLGKLGRPVVPIAAGVSVTTEATELANSQGVVIHLDGSQAVPTSS